MGPGLESVRLAKSMSLVARGMARHYVGAELRRRRSAANEKAGSGVVAVGNRSRPRSFLRVVADLI